MNLNAKEIIAILKAAKSAQVTELKVGGLEVKFGVHDTAQTGSAVPWPTQRSVKPPSDDELKAAKEVAEAIDEKRDSEATLEQMQVTDPSLYEELLIASELEERGSEQTTEH